MRNCVGPSGLTVSNHRYRGLSASAKVVTALRANPDVIRSLVLSVFPNAIGRQAYVLHRRSLMAVRTQVVLAATS